MSPVSLVFKTEVTVSIGLKNKLSPILPPFKVSQTKSNSSVYNYHLNARHDQGSGMIRVSKSISFRSIYKC